MIERDSLRMLKTMCARSSFVRVLTFTWLTSIVLATLSGEEPSNKTSNTHRGELGRDVNPFIGTGGISYLCGNNFPGASVPFGIVRLSPDTVSSSGRKATNTSGYYYADPKLLGFSHTRLVGTGATDGGNFLVIPSTSQKGATPRQGMNVNYSHQDEVAFPGYYSLNFPQRGILAELTATPRVGVHRYTFQERAAPRISLHVTSFLGKEECRLGEV